MNLNSNPTIIKLFKTFEHEYTKSLEKDLYNRYSKDIEKLDELIHYLQSNNNIHIEDENIQIELNIFLEFLANQIEQYIFSDEDQELIALKLVKLKLRILHKIEKNELDGLSLVEANMRKIQAKKYITTSEFEEIYNISKNSQANYRGRLYDPLPYHQKVERGNITYNVKEVENWMENQRK